MTGDPVFGQALSLVSGAVAPDGAVVAIATEDEAAQLGERHGHILIHRNGSWRRVTSVADRCHGVCWRSEPEPAWFVLGEAGDVLRVAPDGTISSGRIYPPAQPGEKGIMSDIRAVGSVLYAAGMRRQVFSDQGSGSWLDIASEMSSWSKPGPIAGFQSVDGFPSQEIYAVGWKGEIAYRKSGQWHRPDSPTNRILSGVTCAPDGRVYACGQRGTLIRGRTEVWEVVETGGVAEDFWDLSWFNGALYVSSLRSVYILTDSGLARVDMGDAETGSCYHLSTAGQYLCSVGARSIGLFDSTRWSHIGSP